MSLLLFQASFPALTGKIEFLGDFTGKQAGRVLSTARKVAGLKVHQYAPVDFQAIKEIAGKENVTDLESLASVIRATSAKKLEKLLESHATVAPITEGNKKFEPRKIEYAVDCYLYCLFDQVFPQKAFLSGTPSKKDVRLVADTPDWKVVRKVNLETAGKDEIMAGMIRISHCALDKEPQFLCKNSFDFDDLADRLLNPLGSRRSFGTITKALTGLNEREVEAELGNIAMDAEAAKQLKELFYLKVFEASGFSPYATIELLNATFPHLKVQKPRGNYGGKRKKK
ncbi:MAG: hypothetical protein ACE5DI_05745 [Candidatus Micrarchaeia archaeon]